MCNQVKQIKNSAWEHVGIYLQSATQAIWVPADCLRARWFKCGGRDLNGPPIQLHGRSNTTSWKLRNLPAKQRLPKPNQWRPNRGIQLQSVQPSCTQSRQVPRQRRDLETAHSDIRLSPHLAALTRRVGATACGAFPPTHSSWGNFLHIISNKWTVVGPEIGLTCAKLDPQMQSLQDLQNSMDATSCHLWSPYLSNHLQSPLADHRDGPCWTTILQNLVPRGKSKRNLKYTGWTTMSDALQPGIWKSIDNKVYV